MARPRRWYCVYDMGLVIAVVEGHEEARRLLGGRRAYHSFRQELEAQEHASWWNYAAYKRGGHLHYLATDHTKE